MAEQSEKSSVDVNDTFSLLNSHQLIVDHNTVTFRVCLSMLLLISGRALMSVPANQRQAFACLSFVTASLTTHPDGQTSIHVLAFTNSQPTTFYEYKSSTPLNPRLAPLRVLSCYGEDFVRKCDRTSPAVWTISRRIPTAIIPAIGETG